MSEPATPARPFYVTGGTLKPGEPSYVERRADTDLFESILAGEFCYILTARQMGKSSLMARTATRLEQAGVASAIVDLTQIGSERGVQGAAQWYFGIANEIHRRLKVAEPLRPWWQERSDLPPAQRLTGFFRELVLTHCPGRVVIFVDEIDSTIGLPFADDFFATLRACFNARATEPIFERLTFVLLGVATPDQLIQDPARTPFNIGKRIDLTDFTPDEARTLAPGLHADPSEAEKRLGRILYWTGGHPYLSQALCRAVRDRAVDAGTAEQAVDSQVEELFLSSRAQREETNLKYAKARLEKSGSEGRRLLQLYGRVRQGKPVPDQPTSSLFAQLKLAGVVKATDEGRLAVRNRVYESVFTSEWAKSAMPADRGWQLAAATLAATLAGVLIWYAAFQPRPYERAFLAAIQDEVNNGEAYYGAHSAYTALRANPFSRSRATELMQQFWEQRGLRYALAGERDESLLSYLQGLRLKDSESLRRRVRNLVGSDYERLWLTFRYTDVVRAVAFSPDGRIIATGSNDGTARLWDTHSGKLLPQIFQQPGSVFAVVFSPDGRTLATATDRDTVRLWDARSGRPLSPTFQGAHAVAFSPDGRTILTGSWDKTTRLQDARSGRPLAPSFQHQGLIDAVAFSPDGGTVLTGSWDNTARLWDARSGKSLTPLLQHQNSILAVAFSPMGKTVLTGSEDYTARLWDARSGKPLLPPLQHQGVVFAVGFSPDGRTALTGSSDDTARLWDSRSGKPFTPPLQHQSSVLAVTFSPDGKTVLTGSWDHTARLWDARSGKPLSPAFQDQGPVKSVALSHDGRTVLTGSWDNTARLWDARSGKSLSPTFQHQGSVNSVAFSPDDRMVLTGSSDGTVRLWDTRSGKPLSTFRYQVPVNSVAFSPDGRTVLAESREKTVRLWDARSGKPLFPTYQDQAPVYAVDFSLDGGIILTSNRRTARLWDARTGKPLSSTFQHQAPIDAVAVSPDGRAVLTGSFNTLIRLWDARTGKLLMSPWEIQEPIWTLAFSPNGKIFFAATHHWLNTYSWDGKKAVLQSCQLLHGFWTKGFRFPPYCERCLQVALGDTGNSFHLETLHLDEPPDPPIEGDPKKLLEKWQGRLGLRFDEQMRPVPAVDFSGEPEGAVGGGRRSPGARPR